MSHNRHPRKSKRRRINVKNDPVGFLLDWCHPFRMFVKDYSWIHTILGIFGNACFFVGSIFFFYESLKTPGIWLFVWGSFGMLIDSLGEAIIKIESRLDRE